MTGNRGPSESIKNKFSQRLLRMEPDKAANIMLDGVAKNKRRVLIGIEANLIDWMQRLLPSSYQ